MGQIRTAPPVKLFVGILSSVDGLFAEAESTLADLYGAVDLRSDLLTFDSTHYYDGEMGAPIWRRFVSFTELIGADRISGIKIETNEVEERYRTRVHDVSRPLNLDPGYVELSKVVLASTKNFYHRIFLAEGIYGEVTLHYSAGAWHPFPWSFPDFRSGRYHEFFLRVRQTYRRQLKVGADPK